MSLFFCGCCVEQKIIGVFVKPKAKTEVVVKDIDDDAPIGYVADDDDDGEVRD